MATRGQFALTPDRLTRASGRTFVSPVGLSSGASIVGNDFNPRMGSIRTRAASRGGALHGLALAVALAATPGTAQQHGLRNPGFEDGVGDQGAAAGWSGHVTGYEVALDTLARSGTTSLRIRYLPVAYEAGMAFQSLPPISLRGGNLRLSGFVRVEDVSGGYAGLWIQVDGPDGVLAFDDMNGRGAIGSAEWAHYELTVPVDRQADRITVGVLLNGRGTAWFDDLDLEWERVDSLPPSYPFSAAQAYLDRALDLMQERSVRRDSVDWAAIRSEARVTAHGALRFSDTYRAISGALRRIGDGHSFLMNPVAADMMSTRSAAEAAPDYGTGELLAGGIGYLVIPTVSGGSPKALTALAMSLQQSIARMDRSGEGVCGWIVDLRENRGGNMWPMVAGIGPVLGEGEAGAFVDADGEARRWGYSSGASWLEGEAVVTVTEPYTLSRPDPPVAVLTGPDTGSSGEAVVTAFRGRPHTRSFGQATRGLSTSNSTIRLDDGALLILTTAVFTDRTGRRYGGPIPPDEQLPSGDDDGGVAQDVVVQRALQWLRWQDGCDDI